jgi:hypothetical protein
MEIIKKEESSQGKSIINIRDSKQYIKMVLWHLSLTD